jgi:ATP synthase F1 delta subunit
MIDERSFQSLAVVAGATGTSSRFSKILTDASLPVAAKIKLLNDVTRNAIGESGEVVDLLKTLFTDTSSIPLPQRLLSVTAGVGFDVAANGGTGDVAANGGTGDVAANDGTGDLAGERLPKVEEGLRSFADLVDTNAELRFAMTDPGATDASKQAIVRQLLTGKVDDIAITLLQVVINVGHGADIANDAKAVADLAAKRQGHVVADVRTAIDLDENYKSRIARVLSAAVGTKVEPRFVVDPSIVGSLVVRVGDEVWDGSVRQRLEQARLALTGATS